MKSLRDSSPRQVGTKQSRREDRVGGENIELLLIPSTCLDKLGKVRILCFKYKKGGNRIGFLKQVYKSPYSIASTRHTF